MLLTRAGQWITLAGGLVLILGGLAAIARYLMRISADWASTRAELSQLGRDIRSLVTAKDRDHELLRDETQRVAARLERHEDWHAQHGR